MLLHTFTNILVKKLFGNDLVGRYSYVSLTIRNILCHKRLQTCNAPDSTITGMH